MNPDNLDKARSLILEEMKELDEGSLEYRILKAADRAIGAATWNPYECFDMIWVASHDLEMIRKEMVAKKIEDMEKNNELDER
jgi:hypothetical protein